MGSWSVQLKVGLVVIIGIVLLVVLIVNAANSPWSVSGELLRVNLNNAGDLRVGAKVQLAGVQVGKVTGVELNEDGTRVEIQMRIKDAFQRLRQGCLVKVGVIGFVGEAYIHLTNGPVGSPNLKPTDLPLTGEDPLDLSEIATQAGHIVRAGTQFLESANQFIESNQENVSASIVEMRALIEQTSRALTEVVGVTDEAVKNLNRIAQENDFRLGQTYKRFNRLMDRLENDALLISSQIGDINRAVLDLVDRNSSPVEQIIVDLQTSATNFRQLSQQLDQDLAELTAGVSDLIAQSQTVIATEKPKVDQLLESLTNATQGLDGLRNNVDQLLHTVQHGEGSIAQLLNKPDALNEVRNTMKTAGETMLALQDLSRRLDQGSEQFKIPEFGWDYELRYLSLEESLHNELGVLLFASDNQWYRLGLGTREEEIKLDFQYGYDFTDNLRGRVGFIRSKVGLGFDVWLLSRRLGITLEGTHLTSNSPELGAEVAWRFFPYGQIIIGAEDLTSGNIRYTAGLRFLSKNW